MDTNSFRFAYALWNRFDVLFNFLRFNALLTSSRQLSTLSWAYFSRKVSSTSMYISSVRKPKWSTMGIPDNYFARWGYSRGSPAGRGEGWAHQDLPPDAEAVPGNHITVLQWDIKHLTGYLAECSAGYWVSGSMLDWISGLVAYWIL